MNFRRFDPRFSKAGRSGLKNGNHLEEAVWSDFHSQPVRLAATAAAILRELKQLSTIELLATHAALEGYEGVEAVEGALLTVQHLRRERSRKIVDRKKSAVIASNGQLACEACGFDFQSRYGKRGVGFIECHHLNLIAESSGTSRTRLSDLALVCANCHRMIHAYRPFLTVMELKQILR